jgi:hypothetical protein
LALAAEAAEELLVGVGCSGHCLVVPRIRRIG